jgi:hypothetical protein
MMLKRAGRMLICAYICLEEHFLGDHSALPVAMEIISPACNGISKIRKIAFRLSDYVFLKFLAW